MTFGKSYGELLRDPRWQQRRLKTLERAGWMCEECGNSERTLHVHHKLYRKGAAPWEYTDAELKCLCEHCHLVETEIRAQLAEALVYLDAFELQAVLGFAQGKAAMVDGGMPVFMVSSFSQVGGVAAAVATPEVEFSALLAKCGGGLVRREVLFEAIKSTNLGGL